jgi:hypothetical protein
MLRVYLKRLLITRDGKVVVPGVLGNLSAQKPAVRVSRLSLERSDYQALCLVGPTEAEERVCCAVQCGWAASAVASEGLERGGRAFKIAVPQEFVCRRDRARRAGMRICGGAVPGGDLWRHGFLRWIDEGSGWCSLDVGCGVSAGPG